MNNKEWKEKTKLNKKTKVMISIYLIMAIFEIVVAITEKNFTWIICAILWGDLAIMEYCKDLIITRRTKNLKHQLLLMRTIWCNGCQKVGGCPYKDIKQCVRESFEKEVKNGSRS